MKNVIDFTIVDHPALPTTPKGFIAIDEWGDVDDPTIPGGKSFEIIRRIADVYGVDEEAVNLATHIVKHLNNN